MNRSTPRQQPNQGLAQQPYQPSGQVQGYQQAPLFPLGATLEGSQGSFELGSSLVRVGRSPANQLRMDDPDVSWFHIQIYPQGQSHTIVDLGSRNGTFLNGQKLPPNTTYSLTDGDTVRIGNVTFSYTTDASVYPPTKVGHPVSMPTIAGFQQQQPYAQSAIPSGQVQSRQQVSLPVASQLSATQLLQKLVYMLPSNTNQATSSNRPSTSRLQASILLYVSIIGVIVCIGGIVLSQYDILPTTMTNITTAIGAFMTFIASIWTVLGKLFPKDVYRSARKLPVVVACIVTVGILIIPMMYLYSLTDPYIHQGQLGLNDPLTNQSQYDWTVQNQIGSTCQFKDRAYHVSHTDQFSNTICQTAAYKNLRDFVYEVEVKIIQGDHAGIVFRIDALKNNYYKFIIAPSGRYWLEARENYGLKDTLATGMSPSSGNDYKIAVVVQGSTITMYVNQQVVVWKRIIPNNLDSAISSGQIGVIAGCDTHPLAEATFSNAKVWEL